MPALRLLRGCVIDNTREEFADGRKLYDVILDIAGNRAIQDLAELRKLLENRRDQGCRRQDVPTRRGSRGDRLPQSRPRPREDRHHDLTRDACHN
jgi:hypothetical protein